MNIIQALYPGDEVSAWVILTLLHLTAVIALAALATRLLPGSHAAARHGIWFCAFLWVLVSPLLPLAGPALGWNTLTLSLPSKEKALKPTPTPQPQHITTDVSDPAPPIPTPLPLPTPEEPPSSAPAEALPAPLETPNEPAVATVAPAPSSNTPISTHSHETHPTVTLRESLGGTLVALWIVGILLLLLRAAHILHHVHRLHRTSTPLDQNRYHSLLQRVSQRLTLSSPLPVRCTDQLPAPIVVGLFRPTVLLPTSLLQNLEEDALEDLLVHEGAHILRKDLVIGHLQRLVAILFWPYPLILFLNRQLSRAREEVCDNHVISTGNAARYAGTLLSVAQAMPPRRALALGEALLPPRWNLEQRIAGLLDRQRRLSLRSPRRLAGSLLLSLGAAGALLAGVQVAAPAPPAESKPTNLPPAAPTPVQEPKEPGFKTVKGLSMKLANTFSEYQHGDPLRFQLTLRNDSKKAFRLMDPSRLYRGSNPDHYAQWTHAFPPSNWTTEANVKDRRAVLIRGLKPGESITVPVLLDDPFYYFPKEKLAGEPIDHLPAGTYQYQPTLKFGSVKDNNPVPFWTGEISALSPKFTIKKRALPGNIAWGEPKQGVRIGLSPVKHFWFTNQPALKVKVWYENTSDKPLKVPRHHMERSDANASFLKFSGRSQGEPFSLTYRIERSATAYPAEVALAPGEIFWEGFSLREQAHAPRRGLSFWSLPRPAPGKQLTLLAHYAPSLEIDSLKANDQRILTSGPIQVTSFSPQGAAAAGAKVPFSSITFDSGTSKLGRWRVNMGRNSLAVTHEWKGKVRKYHAGLEKEALLANAWNHIDTLDLQPQSADQLRVGREGEQLMTFTMRRPDGSTYDHAQWSSALAANPPAKRLLDELNIIATRHTGLLTLWPPVSPPLTEKQAKWVENLKANVDSFTLDLVYSGVQGKPYYTLHLSVPPFEDDAAAPFGFHRHHRITEAQAKKLIDHLANNRFFQEYERSRRMAQSPKQSYNLNLAAGDHHYWEFLEFNPQLFQRLDGLRTFFDGNITTSLDLVAGRISGWRKIVLEKITKPAGPEE